MIPLVERTSVQLPTYPSSVIAIVGSSCSGKSTLVATARSCALDIHFPKRLITRTARLGDDIVENEYCSLATLQRLWTSMQLSVRWDRNLGGEHREHYAFRPLEISMPNVLSANNSFARNESVNWCGAVSPAITLVLIHAPSELRASRLHDRSPDLIQTKAAETEVRLGDNADDLRKSVHFVINNYGKNEALALSSFKHIISDILRITS